MQWVSTHNFFLLSVLLCHWNLFIFSLLAKSLEKKDLTSVSLYIDSFQDVFVWRFLIRLSFFLIFSDILRVIVIMLLLGSNMRIGQSLENDGLQDKSGQSFVFVSKMLLEHSHIHSVSIVWGCFPAMSATFSRHYWDCMVCKAKNIYCLYRKILLISGLGHNPLCSEP